MLPSTMMMPSAVPSKGPTAVSMSGGEEVVPGSRLIPSWGKPERPVMSMTTLVPRGDVTSARRPWVKISPILSATGLMAKKSAINPPATSICSS